MKIKTKLKQHNLCGIGLVFILLALQACKHPLAIQGEGDIVELNETGRGCTLEQFQAGATACTENEVSGDYLVNYRAVPRDGWWFVRWEGPCGHLSESPDCRIESPASWVAYWDATFGGVEIPATKAVFAEIGAEVKVLPLNDTGVPWGGNYPSGNNSSCSGETVAQQDCAHGRDSLFDDDDDGHSGFSFTRLDNTGAALGDEALIWSCVVDNVTSLVWEVKTIDGGVQDQGATYRWGGVSALAGAPGDYYSDWNVLVNLARSESLCGYSDWRVPTVKELENLRFLKRSRPAVDRNFFSGALSQPYWTATPAAGSTNAEEEGADAWYVDFSDSAVGVGSRTEERRVRLVRGGF